jgi:hypothetical protein
MIVFVCSRTGSRCMTTSQQASNKRQMQKYPRERCMNTVAEGMDRAQGAIAVNVKPVQAECDYQRPDCTKEPEVETDSGW